MGIDLRRVETGEPVPGYSDAVYSRDARAREVIAQQVGIELRKLEATHYSEIRSLEEQLGEAVVHDRVRQQLAVQYANHPHLLHLWQHEQGNATATSRGGPSL